MRREGGGSEIGKEISEEEEEMTAAGREGGGEMKCAHAHKSFAREKRRYIQKLSACCGINYGELECITFFTFPV